MTDSDHEFQHYLAWETGVFARMDAAISALAATTGVLLAAGVIPADMPLTAAGVMIAFAGWPGWAALRYRDQHREMVAELDAQGCTNECWSIETGLRVDATSVA
ncbi:hypothetical protein [Nocardia thailandica]